MNNIPHRVALALLVAIQLTLAGGVSAGEFLFKWAIEIDDGITGAETALTGTNDVRKIAELIDTPHLTQLFANKDYSNPLLFDLRAKLDLRGVKTVVHFPTGSTRLEVTFPFLPQPISFDGGDRDSSIERFEEWLRGEYVTSVATTEILTLLLQELVALSAVDPIAGNPNSLQSKMFEAAYFTGTTGVFRPKPGTPEADAWRGEDFFRATGRYERFRGGPWDGNVWELGLDYQVNFKNPKWALLFDLPFIVDQVEGAESFLVSAGIGVMFRPTHWWNITPSFRLGGAGSFKLGAVALMPSIDLTSAMRWRIGPREFSIGGRNLSTTDFELGIGNMFGWASTFDDLEISDIRIAYELNNYALRNGIDLTKRLPLRFLGGQTAVKLFFVDTWILGSRLFLNHYDELGLQVGTQRRSAGKWRDHLSLHAAWVFGNNYDALQLRLSFRY
jgi:hypothetical protein